jgi:hypothetical protein
VKVLVIPAVAVIALIAWWGRKDTPLRKPVARPFVLPIARGTRDGLVVAWRRAGII